MKLINRTYYLICLMLVIFAVISCKKNVEIPLPKNSIVTATVFSDSADATSAVLGIYVNAMKSNDMYDNGSLFLDGAITIYSGLSSDELISNTGVPDEIQFNTNAISSSTQAINPGLWASAYSLIYQTNACIEGLSTSTGLSLSCKSQLTGEAKFVRALIYFNLVNLYGDVPLVTTTDYRVNSSMPRIPFQQAYQQMENDLKDAQQLLISNYPTAGRVRPNQYSATALLARVYLYGKKWADAEAASTSVINNSATYALLSNLNNVFLSSTASNNTEAILQFIPLASGQETAEGLSFIPYASDILPSYTISNSLLNAFEANDQRKTSWLGKNTVDVGGIPTDYYYPFKYQHTYDGLANPKDYYMILRLGEQYLIRAEARAQLDNLTGPNSSSSDLNIIRNRAGLSNTTALAQSDLLDAIYNERKVELFCEWGHRWFDLKRTGQASMILTADKGFVVGTNQLLYPIPLNEIQTNPNLIQNPGY